MKISKISLRGITTYRDLATLDLERLGPGIIAIAGPNGSGKTSLLEAVPGVLYRQTPSRGSIANMATARDAMIEIAGENGAPFVARLDIDNHTGRQEAVFFNEAGEPIAGPKVKEFDAEIAKNFAPLDVYLASFFASQTGAGSVLKMSRSDRRALFGRLLGTERLELMATAARERGRALETEMAGARAALEAIRTGAGDVAALEGTLGVAKEALARAAETAKAAEADVVQARENKEKWSKAYAEDQRAKAAYDDAIRKERAAATTLRDLEAQECELKPILAVAAEIRAAADELRKAELNLTAAGGRADEASREAKRAEAQVAEADGKLRQARAVEAEIRRKLNDLEVVLADAPKIRADATKILELTSEMDEVRQAGESAADTERQAQEAVNLRRYEVLQITKDHEAAARDLADARARAKDAQKRLESAERSTAAVPCAAVLEDETRAGCPALVGHFRTRDEVRKIIDAFGADELRLLAAADAALTAKDKAEAGANDALKSKTAASTVAADLRAQYKALHDAVSRLRAADRSSTLDRAEAEAGALRPNLGQAENLLDAAEADAKAAGAFHEDARRALLEALDLNRELTARVAELRSRDQMKALEGAERAAAELKGRIEPAREAVAEASRISAELAGKVGDADCVAEIMAADAAMKDASEALDQARRDSEDAQAAAVRAEEGLRTARAAKAKADALAAQLAPMEKDLADWRWLARGLGREGVQALELDAAGPRVSGLANELLAGAYGPRFQVRLETQAAKADGKGVRETFDIIVVDTERGREGNGEDLSGGEKVIVGEALGLAVGLFHAQAAGVSLGTVIRDETVGALDPENGERYLAMLRAFLRVGHVHQLLYVAHNPALVEMADAVVRVDDGLITVN